MSHLNVLPSTPPPSPVGTSNNIYPNLPQTQTPHDFRLTKINEITAELSHEVQHDRIVAKKYKRAKTICNWSAGGSGLISAAASSASLGTALSIIGLPATIPLIAVIGCTALASSGFVVGAKKLDAKLKKHNEIVTLALAERDTVDRLVSRAFNDGQVSDAEFEIISAELSQYHVLKERVRAKLTRKPSKQNVDSVDVEKIKDEGRKQSRREAETEYAELAELRKKLISKAE